MALNADNVLRTEPGFVLSDRLVCFFLVCLCFVLFRHTLSYGITWLDDYYLLVQPAGFLADPLNFFKLFTKGVLLNNSGNMYRPLLNATFMADVNLNGSGFFFSHFINIAFHAAGSCLLFYFLRLFSVSRNMAAILAAVFAVHPAAAAAVSWIPGRNDTLLSLLIFPAFMFFEKYRIGGRLKNLLLYSVFFLLALFSKESSVLFPFLCLLRLFLEGHGGEKVAEEKHINIPDNKTILFFLLFSAVPVLIWAIMRAVSDTVIIRPEIMATAANMLYLPAIAGRAVFPAEPVLSATYAHLPHILFYSAAGLVFFAAAYFMLPQKKNINLKKYIFGLCWFFVFLVPTMAAGHGISFGGSYFDHRLYVPLAGIFLILSQARVPFKSRFAGILLAAVFAVFFASVSFCHSTFYENREIFWGRLVKDSPADFDLCVWAGVFEEQRMLYGAADYYYRHSLEIQPAQPVIHGKLALIAYKKGRIKEAVSELRKELEFNPMDKYSETLLKKFSAEAAADSGQQ